jgi:hypothetical protein
LFVDKAGQVSLADLVAMGMSTKNIVLLGDQMQLGQPIQGRHPEDSGESVLDFLLSRKRLNVALSRARSLATIIATPRLLETACNTVEQVVLIIPCAGAIMPEFFIQDCFEIALPRNKHLIRNKVNY